MKTPDGLTFMGSHIIPCEESSTGHVLRVTAVDANNTRYWKDVEVNPCDGDGIADATFAGMDQVTAYYQAKMAKQEG
jgi:hypothetical protein